MRFETVSGKARIAANSRTIGKIRNAEGGRFGLIDAVHELIRGSLSYKVTIGLIKGTVTVIHYGHKISLGTSRNYGHCPLNYVNCVAISPTRIRPG